jgi:hypothetical protein
LLKLLECVVFERLGKKVPHAKIVGVLRVTPVIASLSFLDECLLLLDNAPW